MKKLLIVVALLCCAGVGVAAGSRGAQAAKPTTAANTVFIGWIAINPDDWAVLGYAHVQEWTDVINQSNVSFQRVVQEQLSGRQVAGAKNSGDQDASGRDVQVKFTDVKFDTKSFRLYLAIHLIDPKTGNEIASVPVQGYRGGRFSVISCLTGALEKVADKVAEQVQRVAVNRTADSKRDAS